MDVKVGVSDDGRNPHRVGDIDIPMQVPPEIPRASIPQQITIPSSPVAVNVITPTSPKADAPRKDGDIQSIIFTVLQGFEKVFQETIMDWYKDENPHIEFYCTWTVGIETYFLFMYR